MHQRKMIISGCVTGMASLLLLVAFALHAFSDSHSPLTARWALLAVAAILLGVASIKLLGDGIAGTRAAGHVEGVRETVDRLAAALPKDRR